MSLTTTDCALATALPADPFTALAVHFGMLLGVTDFDTLAANPRGKLRLHNAWLHGEGVVWGYGVTVDGPSREVRVSPGLALDAVGHELLLGAASCLDLGAWYDTTSPDPASGLPAPTNGIVTFDGYLVARYRACLAQPVPTMASPCQGTATGTAYSRVNETLELVLLPGEAPPRVPTFTKLSSLVGLTVPDDPEVAAARIRIALLAPDQRAEAWLDEFAALAAEDVIARQPPGLVAGHASNSTILFPYDEPVDVLLAQFHGLTLTTASDGTRTASVTTIDTGVRWSHVPSDVLSELATTALVASGAGAGGTMPDAGGPRIDPTTAAINVVGGVATVSVSVTGKPLESTIAGGIEVHVLDPTTTNGWQPGLATADFDATNQTLTFALTAVPGSGQLVRVVVHGSGPTPVMGTTPTGLVPFAGTLTGPPGRADDGNDAVFTIQGS